MGELMRSMSLELPRSRSAVSLRHSFHDDTCAAPNDPWFDRYYFDLVKRMPYYKSDFYGIHNWTGPFDYWLDYYPYHRSSYSSYVSPYRQYCLNPVSDTFSRGLYMLRAGRIGFNTLDRYWLSPGYWNRRHTDFRQTHRYEMGKNKTPSYFDKTAKQYFTYWI